MEQSTSVNGLRDSREPIEGGDPGASRLVSRGLMKALELRQLVPGQRLVETDLAAQFGVGRNAVREAVQWLAAHGVVDVTRYRSAAIRQLEPAEALDLLDVAEAMMELTTRTAAVRYHDRHRGLLDAALAELEQAHDSEAPGLFSRARRHFYAALIDIAGNGELQRLFPALGLHIFYAQYRSAELGRLRLGDFRAIAAAISAGDADRAAALGRAHVRHLRTAIIEQDTALTAG